ncbi:MAG: hypothetical protein Q4G34_11065 [Micrococcus sp.]|nr:hypothetical protein [Micrococcus sp.]
MKIEDAMDHVTPMWNEVKDPITSNGKVPAMVAAATTSANAIDVEGPRCVRARFNRRRNTEAAYSSRKTLKGCHKVSHV